MVRFAPLNIPTERRIQTFCVLLPLIIIPTILICLPFILLCFPPLWPFLLAYILWMIFVDYKTPKNGKGRTLKWLKELALWKYFRDYFPAELVKTADLDPQKNYIFGYHPHGIIAMGIWPNFVAESNNFSKLFPGIELKVLTLGQNFKTPFYREWLMALGLADVGRTSIHNILTGGPGNSCMIVVGGAAEALDARPGNEVILTLKNRKGFIKMALLHGASLVPVFCFGENDVYEQVENPRGSQVRAIQNKMKDELGFTLPLIKGRGIFNYDFGLLPHRRHIKTIVGKPLDVPFIAEPTSADIDKYHQLYMDSLVALFEEHKKEFPDGPQKLVLAETY